MNLHLSSHWIRSLACPDCHGRLDEPLPSDTGDSTRCSACDRHYQIDQGIVNFGVRDAFYDEEGHTSSGRTFSSGIVGRLALYFARHHHLYDISRAIPAEAAVVEVGCGGGSRFLASRYDMLGVEISSKSVLCAAQTYPSAVQASLARLPLKDGCADGIVSSCLMEHLGDDTVADCLSEMARILKPGGAMIHFFDLDNDGPFNIWIKSQPWYDPIYVSGKGHIGLRRLEDWTKLFNRAGFTIRSKRLFCKSWLQDLTIWAALDDPEVRGLPRVLGKISRITGKAGNWIPDVIITLIHDFAEFWLPDRWASKAIIELRKAEQKHPAA